MRPFISILTPAYNAAAYLPQLISTVAMQGYDRFEHLVIDDGSTDNTADLLARMSYESRLRWYSRPNKGQYATQNELLAEAKGDVVAIICADDLCAHGDVLARVAKAFEDPRVDVVFGRTPRLVARDDGVYSFDPDMPGWIAKYLVRHVLGIQHCSMYVRADLLRRRSLGFDPSYRLRGDWDWIIRVFSAADKIRYLPRPLALWRSHAGQTSKLQYDLGAAETRRLCAAHRTSYRLHCALALINNAQAQIFHSASIIRRSGIRAYLHRLIRLRVKPTPNVSAG